MYLNGGNFKYQIKQLITELPGVATNAVQFIGLHRLRVVDGLIGWD